MSEEVGAFCFVPTKSIEPINRQGINLDDEM